MSSRGFRFAKRVHRKHKLIRDEVDTLPWPHPRPVSDFRLVAIHASLIWVAVGQAIFGPPAITVQARAFGTAATIVFGIGLTICSLLVLRAAYCRSQYDSFGYEMAGTAGFAGILSIYGVVLALSTPEWALTYNAPFTIALAVGNALRAWVLIRRLW